MYFLQLYWVYNIVLTTKTYHTETKINEDKNKSNSNSKGQVRPGLASHARHR